MKNFASFLTLVLLASVLALVASCDLGSEGDFPQLYLNDALSQGDGIETDSGPQDECQTDGDCPDDGLVCNGTPVCVKNRFDRVAKRGLPNKCGQQNSCEPLCDHETDTCLPCTEAGCDDGVSCTVEYCDLKLGHCVFNAAPGKCLIGAGCYDDGDTNPYDECEICLPEAENKDWSANSTPQCQPIEVEPDRPEVVDTDTDGETEAPDILDTDSEMPDEFTPPDTEDVEEPDLEEPDNGDSEIPLDVTDPPPDEGEDLGEPEEISEPADSGPDTEDIVETDLCQEVNCDDDNPCTDNSCDPTTGSCVFVSNSNPCEDGNLCTENDICSDGTCQPGANMCECTQDADCVAFEDGNVCNGTLVCDNTHHCDIAPETVIECDQTGVDQCSVVVCIPESGDCVLESNLKNNQLCQDGNECTQGDVCYSGLCTGKQRDCDDDNPCTTDFCDSQIGCRYENNKTECSDSNACTQGDVCSDGTCQPGATQTDCNDGNACTTDSCVPATGCESTATVCDDQNACTTDACDPATGCKHWQVNCDDGNDCTAEACDPVIGCKSIAVGSFPCNDGSVCTINDICLAGNCVGKQIECDDNNPCTDEACDPVVGCVSVPNDALCDDGVPCTINTCDLHQGCKFAPDHSVCDDGAACTDDFCDPTTGCFSVFDDTDGDEICDADDPDDDNDGIEDGQDNCPVVANSDQKNIDDDEYGDACDLVKDCYEYGVANQYLPATFVNTNSCAEVCLTVSGKLACLYTKQTGNSTCTKDQDNDGVSIMQGDCNGNTTNIVFQCHPLPPEDKPDAPDNYGCIYNNWARHPLPPPPAEDP